MFQIKIVTSSEYAGNIDKLKSMKSKEEAGEDLRAYIQRNKNVYAESNKMSRKIQIAIRIILLTLL